MQMTDRVVANSDEVDLGEGKSQKCLLGMPKKCGKI